MNSLTLKIAGIICGVILLVSFAIGIAVLWTGDFIDLLLRWSESIIIVMAFAGIIVAPIWSIVNLIIKLNYNFSKRKNEIIIWAVVLLIPLFIRIGVAMAPDALPTFFGVEDYDLTIGKSKLVDAALYVTYLYASVALICLLFTFAKDIISGKQVK